MSDKDCIGLFCGHSLYVDKSMSETVREFLVERLKNALPTYSFTKLQPEPVGKALQGWLLGCTDREYSLQAVLAEISSRLKALEAKTK